MYTFLINGTDTALFVQRTFNICLSIFKLNIREITFNTREINYRLNKLGYNIFMKKMIY